MSTRFWIAIICITVGLDAYVIHLFGEVAEMRQTTAELRDGIDRMHWRLVGMRSEHANMDYQLTEMEADAVCGALPSPTSGPAPHKENP